MLSDKDRLTKLEKKTDELIEAKDKFERQLEIQNEIDKFIKKQEKGLLKYALDIFKLLVILAIAYTGSHKALDSPWMQKTLKEANK